MDVFIHTGLLLYVLAKVADTYWHSVMAPLSCLCCFFCVLSYHLHLLSQPVRLYSLAFFVVTWLLATHLQSASGAKAVFYLFCLCGVRTAHNVKLLTLADICLCSQHLNKCLLSSCSKIWERKKKKKKRKLAVCEPDAKIKKF